jgi:hypothetical protein
MRRIAADYDRLAERAEERRSAEERQTKDSSPQKT